MLVLVLVVLVFQINDAFTICDETNEKQIFQVEHELDDNNEHELDNNNEQIDAMVLYYMYSSVIT
jgi:hypothetical protein